MFETTQPARCLKMTSDLFKENQGYIGQMSIQHSSVVPETEDYWVVLRDSFQKASSQCGESGSSADKTRRIIKISRLDWSKLFSFVPNKI
jgi:hypothetical protein